MFDPSVLPDAVTAAHEVISEILIQGAEDLYMNHISLKSNPFAMRTTTDILISTLDFFYLRHDQHSEGNWIEETEPLPCTIDTWARNAIRVHKKFKPIKKEITFTQPADTRSMKSYKSSRSTKSAFGMRAKKLTSKSIRGNEIIGEDPQPFPLVIEKLQITEEEELLRVQKEKENQKKAEENERNKKIKEELEENEKRLKKEAAELKKKQFTYDIQGNIMLVNQLKYDQIPKVFTEIEVKPFDTKKDTVLPPMPKKFIDEANRLKTAPVKEQEWVKNATSVQPLMIEAIKLNPGVTFVDGNRVKHPPAHSTSHKNLTRKEYHYQSIKQSKLGVPNESEKKLPHVSSHDSFKKNSRNSINSSYKDAIEDIPDYENKHWLLNDSQEGPPDFNRKNFGKINGNKDESPIRKFNEEIMNNKNWGMNPNLRKPIIIEKLPKKPSTKDLIEIYGNIIKKPKDKPFITPVELWEAKSKTIKKPRDRPYVEKIDKKTKMPPPPYGYTMINALPDYEELFK